MKSLNDPLFKKSEIFNLMAVNGGSKTTQHDPTWSGGSNGHYICDHSPDPDPPQQ